MTKVTDKKAEEYLAGWQRAKADYENLRKRTDEQRLLLVKTATHELIMQLLPVLDSVDASLKHLQGEARTPLEIIAKQLRGVLAGQGVTIICAAGKKFDPALHEAVTQVPGQPGICVAELAAGYKLHDQVLRPARVSVGQPELKKPIK